MSNFNKTMMYIAHDNLQRQVSAVRTYINTGEFRLAKQSLAHAKRNLDTLSSLILDAETIKNESEKK